MCDIDEWFHCILFFNIKTNHDNEFNQALEKEIITEKFVVV